MQADFLDAHERHWEDAEQLYRAQRFANADHLYGMAAECGLKRLMVAFGMQVDSNTGSPQSQSDRTHVDGVWVRYESYRARQQATDYCLPASSPFAAWHVSDRYAHQSNFNQPRTTAHKAGADQVRQLIKKAQREGLI